MKIVKPSVETIHGGNATRILYAGKKYYEISGVSTGMPAEFLRSLVRWREEDLLEHSMVAFLIPCDVSEEALRKINSIQLAVITYERQKRRPANIFSENYQLGGQKYMMFFGNIRAWRNVIRLYNQLCIVNKSDDLLLEIRGHVEFEDFVPWGYSGCTLDLSPFEIRGDVRMGDDVIEYPRIMTARFRCSMAVANEISRFKFMATYVPEYLFLKLFSEANSIEFVEPFWWNDKDDPKIRMRRTKFEQDCVQSEQSYLHWLLKMEEADARTALNGNACVEVVQTALINDWVEWDIKNSTSENGDVRRIAQIFRDEAGGVFEDAIQKASNGR